MSQDIYFAHPLEQPALYVLTSLSSTVYYLNTRDHGAWLYRARGAHGSSRGAHDDEWVPLTRMTSLAAEPGCGAPELCTDKAPWVLRVGHRHAFDFHVPGGMMDITDFWWIQRVLERIETIDEMPPEGARATETSDPRPTEDKLLIQGDWEPYL